MATQFLYELTDTWNSGVTSYNAFKMNVADAASAADSKLINFQINSVEKFTVDKNGNLVAAGGLTLATALPVTSGGTGGKTKEDARTGLGLGTAATSAANDFAGAAHSHALATSAAPGFMSATDKVKVDASAPLDSPALIGNPTAPTPAAGDADTSIATTAFVQGAVPVKAAGGEVAGGTVDTKFATPKALIDAMVYVPFNPAAFNLSNFINGKVTLAANASFAAPTGAREGASGILAITQDATGGRTGSWATFWDFGKAGVPTLSTAPGATDYVAYVIAPGAAKAYCTFLQAA